MNIKVELVKWYDDRRVTVHLFPNVLIDVMTIGEHKNTTILISWLLWSIGIGVKKDDWNG